MDEDQDDYEDMPKYCLDHDEANYFGNNESLKTLWAAVQTELLTYRRLAEGDPWISVNLDMKVVLESLEAGQELAIGLVSKGMIKPFCKCGMFCNSEYRIPPCLDEACAYYFSNLEDYNRSSFLQAPLED